MGRLFISHASQDSEQAKRVLKWLNGQGFPDVFLDLDPHRGLAPGERWQAELKRAGEMCSAVIVLVSPHWAASKWCLTEFLVADQLGKRIFPVFVAPTPFDALPGELKAKFQLADISTPEKEADGFARLEVGLKRAGLDPRAFEWPPAHDPDRPVYRGLQALDVDDAAIFFGRDGAITRGLNEMRRLRAGAAERALVILGASGAGKSSFMRAGLLARLTRDIENYVVLPAMRPGRAALTGPTGFEASLAKALGRSASINASADVVAAFAALRRLVVEAFQRNAEAVGETHLAAPPTIVVPIDQAEELFFDGGAESARALTLFEHIAADDPNVLFVATIRTDSYEQIQRSFLPEKQCLFTLPQVAPGAFKEIIEGPARLAKPAIEVEPALTDQLLADLSEEDALPLLAFTMERLLREAGAERKLTLALYQSKIGGVSGAIRSAIASAIGETPTPDTLALARRLFIPALVRVEPDGVKRRRATRAELPSETQSLAQKLIDQHLLVTENESIEVAHEAILRHWPALNGWIAEEHGALASLTSARVAALDWRAHAASNNSAAWLTHRGARLADAAAVLQRGDFAGVLDENTRAYLGACAGEEQKARRGRRMLQGAAAFAGFSAIALLSAWLNWERINPEVTRFTKFMPYLATAAQKARSDGATFQDCAVGAATCPVMVAVPAGTFRMGPAPDGFGFEPGTPDYEQAVKSQPPQKRVGVVRFAVSQTEITFAHWQACVDGGGCRTQPAPDDRGWGRGDRPVINVSAADGEEYTQWLSHMTGGDYRLLTEAEWEYAARATKSADSVATYWSFGDDEELLQEYAVYGRNSNLRTAPVRSKTANAFGLFDMYGNVSEWTQDCQTVDTDQISREEDTEADKAAALKRCDFRALRGGNWGYVKPKNLTSTSRFVENQYARKGSIGFRVAKTLE